MCDYGLSSFSSGDRSTLSKKENEQHQQNSIPTKIDSSRGFRTTVITKMAAAASKPKKSLVSAKKHSQQVKQKVKTAKLNPRPPGKQDKVDKKKPQSMPKPPGPKPTGKLEFVKPEMSEISMNARGVEPSCGVNHMPQRYILFIGNLPYTVDKGQLMVHFRKTGTVQHHCNAVVWLGVIALTCRHAVHALMHTRTHAHTHTHAHTCSSSLLSV